MIGSLLAVDWQAGVAWFALMALLLGGLGVFVGLAAIVVRAKFFTSNDEDGEDLSA